MLAAARALLAEGAEPTVTLTAERALVSEATAYRYYSDARSLLRDAVALQWPSLEAVLGELRLLPDAAARAHRAVETMARHVIANEAKIRAMIALSYTPQPGNPPATRPAFRLILIDAVLEPLERMGDAEQRQRLRLALSAIIGAEAFLSLKDSSDTSDEDILATLAWSAEQLVSAWESAS